MDFTNTQVTNDDVNTKDNMTDLVVDNPYSSDDSSTPAPQDDSSSSQPSDTSTPSDNSSDNSDSGDYVVPNGNSNPVQLGINPTLIRTK
jgi:hypothetical protein